MLPSIKPIHVLLPRQIEMIVGGRELGSTVRVCLVFSDYHVDSMFSARCRAWSVMALLSRMWTG